MKIIRATKNNIDDILVIKHIARARMVGEGNHVQWSEEDGDFTKDICDFIDKNEFYLVEDNNEIVGMFAMIIGVDHTYDDIRNGKWINDDKYVTIHKIAAKYQRRHIASFILDYVKKYIKSIGIYNIRIDTYKDNKSMANFLKYHGFVYCGIISIKYDFDNVNSLRNAYQLDIR